jgi:hypothetical protein
MAYGRGLATNLDDECLSAIGPDIVVKAWYYFIAEAILLHAGSATGRKSMLGWIEFEPQFVAIDP